MSTFKAFRIHESAGRIAARFEDLTLEALTPGEVVIDVQYSGINYKDALAATGAGKILRRYPLVGGIDLAGAVKSSDDLRFKAGEAVLVTGSGLSESFDGGYAEVARVNADSVISMPPGLDAFRAMALGTAGFTAALAIHRMERNGQEPARGPIVVTGATGGVGSIAIDMLAGRGYEVIAVSGKAESFEYLKSLGASKVLPRGEFDLGSRALEPARYAGAIDSVGGEILAGLTRQVDFWGNIASVGLAGGADLKTTVMPFILRGVNLLGINSSATPRTERLEVWQRIATDLAPRHLARIASRTIPFAELPGAFQAYLDGKVTGRTVVKIAARP
ncbi:MAG TPA: oxidoreductase [Steroidobacteraceae bacterium]|jgi:NADPH2:quinone reductase|nr:oxidoreductase [Steroidobacteraceae bacterium]